MNFATLEGLPELRHSTESLFCPAGTSKYDGQCQSLHRDWSWLDSKFGCSLLLSLSLSLSLVVYDVQTCRNIVFIYSHIVYVDYRRKFRSLTSDNMDS